jgi:AraC family transcriptional regulator, ethanolamine operon transcriptional activator
VGWECSTFDQYSDKIREADALSLMTAPLTGPLDFAQHVLPRTILQFGSGGSGTIVHGTTRFNPCFLFMQSATCADRIVFDGRSLQWPGIVMIPPASHFTFACTGPTQWISLAVPADLTNGITNGGFKKYLAATENAKILITPPAAEFTKLIEAATTARNGIRHARPAHLQAIEASLLGILDRILLDSVSQRRCFDKRTEKVMSTVLECLRRDGQIHVVALARAAGVSERTLHRLFWKYFHMGPKRYSKVRQLNVVRRAIRQNHATPVNVTGILTEHGVTEFGRFAIEYKALFNESPAETLHKHLAPPSDGYHMSYERMS